MAEGRWDALKRFRHLKSVSKSYEEQGAIYFACATYRDQPAAVRRKIDRLCERAGGEYAPALKEFLTTGADWAWICDRYYLSERTLDRARKKFYELW